MDARALRGYTRLAVTLGPRAVLRFVYARVHAAKDAQLPRGRTLFVVNLPRTASDEGVAAAFAQFGEVAAVHRAGGADDVTTSAHVIFAHREACSRALEPTPNPLDLGEPCAPPEPVANGGMGGGTIDAELRDRELKARVNAYMAAYDERQRQEAEARKASEGVPDDDGFVTVSYKGKRGRRDGPAENGDDEGDGTGAPASRKKKHKKSLELPDFYHFQQHERKREQLASLRARFEQDKERIAKLRAQRKFKPE